MDLEDRKNNKYFDQTGTQILVGDLLKIFHFKSGRRNYYMYHVVVMEYTNDFPVMALKSYYADKPHYRMYAIANNRVYLNAKIISKKDTETTRNKIKL